MFLYIYLIATKPQVLSSLNSLLTGRNTPSSKANSGRQPGVFASQIHTNYQHCGLFALPVTPCGASLGEGKKKKISIIMSGANGNFSTA